MAVVLFVLLRKINCVATCSPPSPPSTRRGLSMGIGIRLLCISAAPRHRIYATDNPQQPVHVPIRTTFTPFLNILVLSRTGRIQVYAPFGDKRYQLQCTVESKHRKKNSSDFLFIVKRPNENIQPNLLLEGNSTSTTQSAVVVEIFSSASLSSLQLHFALLVQLRYTRPCPFLRIYRDERLTSWFSVS